jgi:hypothetical protein
MVLLPQRSADGRTVYNWIFVAMLIVIAGVVSGAISGIRRAWLIGNGDPGANESLKAATTLASTVAKRPE